MTYSRQLTSTEKVYVASGMNSTPCINQLMLEGTGVLDKKKWQTALRQAGEANPGTRLAAKGALAFGRWVDTGKPPGLREVDGSGWSGMNEDGSSFLYDNPLDPFEGTTSEVVLVHGESPRIVFRSHHAVMDGRGTVNWMLDTFRAMRGEPMIGHPSTITEYSLARSFQSKGRTPAPHHFPAITGPADLEQTGFSWQRIHIPDNIRAVLPKVALILAQEIWLRNPGCPVRFGIPVDMRQRDPSIRSTGNLSNLIYLDVTPSDTLDTLRNSIKTQLSEKNDGMLYWADSLIRHVPFNLIQRSLKDEIRAKQRSGLYRNSGVISNMAKVPIQEMFGGGFTPNDICGIPIVADYLPFFSGIGGGGNNMNFVMGMSKTLASRGRLTNVMQKMLSSLSEDQ